MFNMANNHVKMFLFLSATIMSFTSPVIAQQSRSPFGFPVAAQTSPNVPYTFPQLQNQMFPLTLFPNSQQQVSGTGSQVPSMPGMSSLLIPQMPGTSPQNPAFASLPQQFSLQFGQNLFTPQQPVPNQLPSQGQNPFSTQFMPLQFPNQAQNPFQPPAQPRYLTQPRLPFPNQGQTQFPNMVRPMFPNQAQTGFQNLPQFPNQIRPQFPNQQQNQFLNQFQPQVPNQGQFSSMVMPQLPNQGQPMFPNQGFPQLPNQAQGQLPNQMRPTFPNQVAPMPPQPNPGTSQSQGQIPNQVQPNFPFNQPNFQLPQRPTNPGQMPNQIGQPQQPTNPQEGPREVAAKEARDLILSDRNLSRQVKSAVSTKTRDPSFMMCPLVMNPNLPPPNLSNDILVQACLAPRTCQTLNQERVPLCSSQPNTCAFTLRLVQLCPLLRLPPGPQGRNSGSRPAPPGASSGTTPRPLDIMLQRLINTLRANGGRLPGFTATTPVISTDRTPIGASTGSSAQPQQPPSTTTSQAGSTATQSTTPTSSGTTGTTGTTATVSTSTGVPGDSSTTTQPVAIRP